MDEISHDTNITLNQSDLNKHSEISYVVAMGKYINWYNTKKIVLLAILLILGSNVVQNENMSYLNITSTQVQQISDKNEHYVWHVIWSNSLKTN